MINDIARRIDGAGNLLFQSANPFKNFSATSLEKMASKETLSLMLVGRALSMFRKKDFEGAVEDARKNGFNPETFVFLNENFQTYTPVLAMVARSTTAGQNLAVSTLSKKGADAWDLRLQQSRVSGLHPEKDNHYLALPFEASVLLLACLNFDPAKNGQGLEEAKKYLGRLFQACDAHPEVDWERPIKATNETPLGLAARCLDVSSVNLLWGFLKDRGADPFRPGLNQLSPFDIMEARVGVTPNGTGIPLLARDQAAELMAQWREVKLLSTLGQAPVREASRRHRM